MQYSLKEVKEKIEKYKTTNKYVKTNSYPKEFEELENLTGSIKGAIKNACAQYGVPYTNSFDLLINHTECAMLSSRNWFNSDGLNFTSIRDILKIDVKSEDNFVRDFKLQIYQKGTKKDRQHDIVELIGLAQSGAIETGLEGYIKWSYLKSMRIGKISIENNSDVFKTNVDFNATCSNPLIKKRYNEPNSLLACIHYHSFAEKDEEYSPILDKYELALVIVK